jgi:16S rRNA C967 or C1407 C5-methylase (RsmB/RsmF family)
VEGKKATAIARVINNTQAQIDVLSKKKGKTKAEKDALKRLKAELKVYKEDYKALPELYKQKGPLALEQLNL